VDAVRARSAQNGHRLRGSGYLDHGDHGRHAASHAEKAQPPNTPGGVAWPMCRDCIKYWQREATHHKQDQFQADTQMARVFKPGERGGVGKIVEYHYDGRVVEVTGRKSVQTRAPERGGPRAPASAERPARPTSVAAERLANLRTALQSRPISRHWSAAVSHPADFTARTVTRTTGGAARGLTKM
jgi:hypothetical protein